MANQQARFTEVSTSLVHTEGNNHYSLRVIEYLNRDGVRVRKFGLSEFWFCEKANRWYPSKKHHVYLPMPAWRKLIALTPLIEQATLDEPNGERPSGSGNATVKHSDVARQQSGTGRRRGRPPKRANECADNVAGKGASPNNPSSPTEGHTEAKTRREDDNVIAEAHTYSEDDEHPDAGTTVDDERAMQFYGK